MSQEHVVMGSDDEQTSSKELPVLDHSLDGGVKLKAADRPNRATNKVRLMGHPFLIYHFFNCNFWWSSLSVASEGYEKLSNREHTTERGKKSG